MNEADRGKFVEALKYLSDAACVELSASQISVFWNEFKDFQLNDFRMACRKWIDTQERFPMPAGLKKLMPGYASSKHISADEAWTIALRSMDEAETVVMTDEIMQARAIAWDVWDGGDKVAARMAFKGAYERLVSENNPPKWRVIQGHDPARREEAVAKAVSQGLLPKTELAKYAYLGFEKNQVTVDRLAITSTTKTEAMILDGNDKILTELQELRQQLVSKNEDRDKQAAEMVERLRMRKEAAEAASKIISQASGALND